MPTSASGITSSLLCAFSAISYAALDLADVDGVEIVADDDAVLHAVAEAGLKALGLRSHAIEDAAG